MILFISADPEVNSISTSRLSLDDSFRLLSGDIIDNRRRINKLYETIRILEDRIWELEDHSQEDSLLRAERMIQEWTLMADGLSAVVGEKR